MLTAAGGFVLSLRVGNPLFGLIGGACGIALAIWGINNASRSGRPMRLPINAAVMSVATLAGTFATGEFSTGSTGHEADQDPDAIRKMINNREHRIARWEQDIESMRRTPPKQVELLNQIIVERVQPRFESQMVRNFETYTPYNYLMLDIDVRNETNMDIDSIMFWVEHGGLIHRERLSQRRGTGTAGLYWSSQLIPAGATSTVNVLVKEYLAPNPDAGEAGETLPVLDKIEWGVRVYEAKTKNNGDYRTITCAGDTPAEAAELAKMQNSIDQLRDEIASLEDELNAITSKNRN